MGSDDDIIIRNGTFKQWLNYYVVLGGQDVLEPYGKITGGLRVKGVWFVGLAALLGLVVGALVG